MRRHQVDAAVADYFTLAAGAAAVEEGGFTLLATLFDFGFAASFVGATGLTGSNEICSCTFSS